MSMLFASLVFGLFCAGYVRGYALNSKSVRLSLSSLGLQILKRKFYVHPYLNAREHIFPFSFAIT